MFETSAMLYIYVETPLHAGSGSSVGVVDLPIQRERVTGYPLVQASGIKGKLRAEAGDRATGDDEKQKVQIVFGSEQHEFAGALSPGDARLLLFPVRSLMGVFAWTTSRGVLARLVRDLQAAGKGDTAAWRLDGTDSGAAWVSPDSGVTADGRVVLEEFAFAAEPRPEVKALAEWLASNVFPQTEDYEYFRGKVLTNLVILPEDAFRDFTLFATEVVARIKIRQDTKTVDGGALWTEEHLPSDTLLYSPLHATRPRSETNLFDGDDGKPAAAKVLDYVRGLNLERIQLGGDETVGRGIVRLHLA